MANQGWPNEITDDTMAYSMGKCLSIDFDFDRHRILSLLVYPDGEVWVVARIDGEKFRADHRDDLAIREIFDRMGAPRNLTPSKRDWGFFLAGVVLSLLLFGAHCSFVSVPAPAVHRSAAP